MKRREKICLVLINCLIFFNNLQSDYERKYLKLAFRENKVLQILCALLEYFSYFPQFSKGYFDLPCLK